MLGNNSASHIISRNSSKLLGKKLVILLYASAIWISVPSGGSQTLIHLTLQKPEMSAGSIVHLARKGFTFYVAAKTPLAL